MECVNIKLRTLLECKTTQNFSFTSKIRKLANFKRFPIVSGVHQSSGRCWMSRLFGRIYYPSSPVIRQKETLCWVTEEESRQLNVRRDS
jgi:hypothetical protein